MVKSVLMKITAVLSLTMLFLTAMTLNVRADIASDPVELVAGSGLGPALLVAAAAAVVLIVVIKFRKKQ